MRQWKKKRIRVICLILVLIVVTALPGSGFRVHAESTLLAPSISAPSAILIEASTGEMIYGQNFTERRSPASITKIMTLLLTFEYLDSGKAKLDDVVAVSEHAASMGGSQVFLAEGETQTLETMIKCIVVASGNDASVAVAEHIAGSEEAFVEMMNEKALELGMTDTHFVDCCGLSDSDEHYTCARDVAIMARELTRKHPDIFTYSQIWTEDIVHETRQGSSIFTLNSTNKLLKQYPYATGLKTGSTSKAMFCLAATATKNDVDLIAVIMGASDNKTRVSEAKELLTYGFLVCRLYVDENAEDLPEVMVEGGVEEAVGVKYAGEFRYLDVKGNDLDGIKKEMVIPAKVDAPVEAGAQAGEMKYFLGETELGSVPILFESTVEKAHFVDYLKKVMGSFLI